VKFSTTAANCQFKSCSQRSFASFHSRIDWWSCVRSRQQSWQLLEKDISTHLRKSHTQIQSNWLVTSLLVCLLAEQGLTCPPAVSCLPWKKSIFVHLHESNIQASWHPQLCDSLYHLPMPTKLFLVLFRDCTVAASSNMSSYSDMRIWSPMQNRCLFVFGFRVLSFDHPFGIDIQRLARRDATELHKNLTTLALVRICIC